MSKLEVDAIEPQSGTTLTLGASGDAVALGSGASVSGLTLSDNILFNAASKGVYLGVTTPTASNLLDDYEEGTFTSSFGGSGSDPTASTNSTRNSYTKIGNTVVVSIYLSNMNTTGASGNMEVKGLPFAAETANNTTYIGSSFYSGFSATYLIPYISPGSSVINFNEYNALTSGLYAIPSGTGRYMAIQITYKTT